MQPGQTVSPGGGSEPSWQYNPDQPQSAPSQTAPAEPAAVLPPVQAQASPQPQPQVSTVPATTPQPDATVANNPSVAAPQSQVQPAVDRGPGVDWTASEFIAHDKNGAWYVLVIICALIGAGLVFLLTRDPVPTGIVVIVAVIFAIAAGRKPRQLTYRVDNYGVQIAAKNYPYSSFRSFSVVQEGGIESIWFTPLKRFMPMISIYFDPNDGDRIVDTLSEHLPFEDRDLDLVDRLMHRLRF